MTLDGRAIIGWTPVRPSEIEIGTNISNLRAGREEFLAQPHLNAEKMWTLDDIKNLNFEIRDPLRGVEAPPGEVGA